MSVFQNFLEVLCSKNHQTRSKISIVQVGANDGKINDPIYESVKKYHDSTRVLLIEPQEEVLPYLANNYKFHSDATIWNGAIGRRSTLIFYRLRPELYTVFKRRYLMSSPLYRVPTGFTSSDYDHVLKHLLGNLPENVKPEEAIETISCRCASLIEVFEFVGWKERSVDVLQVDAEGADDEVLYASSLEVFHPMIINFEHRHLAEPRRAILGKYLSSLGYRLRNYDRKNAIAVSLKRAKDYGIEIE